jgi:hypothetical protein
MGRKSLQYLMVIPVAHMLAGCATGRGGVVLAEDEIGDAIMIEVQNNSQPPGPITIWIIAQGGGRRNLGSISADRTRTFSFDETGLPREFQLMAVLDDRREIRSRPFELFERARVRWWLETNDVRITPGPR